MAGKTLLKDQLFNLEKITKLANEIKIVYPKFKKDKFISEAITKFPELELKQRIYHIKDLLNKFLPFSYKDALAIILKALPKELNLNKTDNDFGDFIYAPYSEFVTSFGCKLDSTYKCNFSSSA